MAPFRSVAVVPHPLADREPFGTSWRRYGFPFVGSHWIPHFTVASLLTAPDDPAVAEVMSVGATHHFTVDSVSVWRVRGDEHERLAVLGLAAQPEPASS
jgi:hypothetical protein